MLKKILILVLTLSLLLPYSSVFAEQPIVVYKMGQRITFPDQQPVVSGGRTLVPVRFIAEAFGATVTFHQQMWCPNHNLYLPMVELTHGSGESFMRIFLILNKRAMWKNFTFQEIDVASTVINGRTMVPLRLISELFGTEVTWVDSERRVNIRIYDPWEFDRIAIPADLAKHMETARTPELWINGERQTFGRFKPLRAYTNRGMDTFMLIHLDDMKRIFNLEMVEFKQREGLVVLRSPDGTIHNVAMHTSAMLVKNEYTLNGGNRTNLRGLGYIGAFHINEFTYKFDDKIQPSNFGSFIYYRCERTADVFLFDVNKKLNHRTADAWRVLDTWSAAIPVESLTLGMHITQQEYDNIKAFTANLVVGVESDSARTRLLYDWIASNIHYDFDALASGRFNRKEFGNRVYDTFRSRRGVCYDYSKLLSTMLYSLGIQNKILYTATYFGELHSLNLALVGGRWILMDPTWASVNSFINGELRTRPPVQTQLDRFYDIARDRMSGTPIGFSFLIQRTDHIVR